MSESCPEFSGERSRSYKEALAKFPDVWAEDMLVMKEYLRATAGEKILEIGAGSGFFSFEICKLIGPEGHLWVTDPSMEQLQPIIDRQPKNITVLPFRADQIQLPFESQLDAIWSRGAMHHASDKMNAFTAEESLQEAEVSLGVKKVNAGYALYWPMTLMTTTRL